MQVYLLNFWFLLIFFVTIFSFSILCQQKQDWLVLCQNCLHVSQVGSQLAAIPEWRLKVVDVDLIFVLCGSACFYRESCAPSNYWCFQYIWGLFFLPIHKFDRTQWDCLSVHTIFHVWSLSSQIMLHYSPKIFLKIIFFLVSYDNN